MLASLYLKRLFLPVAVLIGLLLVLMSNNTIFYSTNIRVDLLAYWFCLFSYLALLKNRYHLAGILLGLGFITSQKAIWFVLASNGALGIYWVVFERRVAAMFNLIRLNLAILAIITIYIIFWGFFSSIATVMQNVWFDAAAMYHLEWYDSARAGFWQTVILYNPALFLLWPLPLISLLVTYEHDQEYKPRFLIVAYSLIILCCLLFYKQVFPYYMQITIPVFFLLYTAFISWLFKFFSKNQIKLLVPSVMLWLFSGIYILGIVVLLITLNLPIGYAIVSILPFLLVLYVIQLKYSKGYIALLTACTIGIVWLVAGIIYPCFLNVVNLVKINGKYQRANIEVISKLLNDGSDYIAGIELVFYKKQSIVGLRHLMGPAIAYLYKPTAQLREVMLPSLYQDPQATLGSIIEDLKKAPVKFYVNNYRIQALPPKLKNFLSSQYTHFWGSIYLYAPEVNVQQREFLIKFKGSYVLDAGMNRTVMIDGKSYCNHQIIKLNSKKHISKAKERYRLKLISENVLLEQDTRFNRDQWERFLFI